MEVIVNKTFAVIKREYLTRVKTKGFIIGTLLLPVFIIAVSVLPALLMHTNTEKSRTVAVIDFTEQIFEPFQESLNQNKKTSEGKPLYKLLNIKDKDDMTSLEAKLTKQINDEELDAYLVIPDSIFENNSFSIYSKNVSNIIFNETIERTVSDIVSNIRMNESGLDPQLVKELGKRVNANTFKVGEQGSEETSGELAFGFSYIMIFILYMTILLYGTFVMRGIIEDKNSRVIEVVISSVKPFQYMTGKVIGIAATGLSQFLIWIAFALFLSTYGLIFLQQMAPEIQDIPFPTISIWIYFAFIIYFLLGFFFYSSLFAAIGSMVNSESEAQSYQWVVMVPIILAFMLMFTVMNNPDSSMATVLSFIPFFTPILMFLRISLNAAPLVEILASLGVMFVSIWLSILIGGRIFRIGILMYGKRPTLPEIIKWIKYS